MWLLYLWIFCKVCVTAMIMKVENGLCDCNTSEGSEWFYIWCKTKTTCKMRKRSHIVGEWFPVPLASPILLSAGILDAPSDCSNVLRGVQKRCAHSVPECVALGYIFPQTFWINSKLVNLDISSVVSTVDWVNLYGLIFSALPVKI